MISVLDAEAVGFTGLGEVSEPAPHGFIRIVSLGLIKNEPTLEQSTLLGEQDTMLGAWKLICIVLKGPLELVAENNQLPSVL